jgi:hypothetical protein
VFLSVSFKPVGEGPEAGGGAKEDGEDEEGESEDEGYGVGEEGWHDCFNMGAPWWGGEKVGDDGNGSWFFWSLGGGASARRFGGVRFMTPRLR